MLSKWQKQREKIILPNHQLGKPCNCILLKCFEVVSLHERRMLLKI